MAEKTNAQVIAEMNAVDELRDKLIDRYPAFTQDDADWAAEWAYDAIRDAVAAEREACAAFVEHHAEEAQERADKSYGRDLEITRQLAYRAHVLRQEAAAIRARDKTGSENDA